ncbi:hypothetical protein [Amycolatopsis sp. cg13]|uniref:hypothetical protein n=1 Tax=Amycolatopsis sp. cg13 TaxID=3238807 RepID=UPI0035252D72
MRGAGVGSVLIGFAGVAAGPFLAGLGVVAPGVGSATGAGFALVAGSGEELVLRAGFAGDGAGLGLAEGFGLADRSGLGAGFGLVDRVDPGLAVGWLGSAVELRMGLGSGVGEGACAVLTGVGFGPPMVAFGAGPGVESMPLTLVDVGGGTGLGSGAAAGLAEVFGLVLAEPGLGFGVRTESGDEFAPETWSAAGLGATAAFGPGDGFEEPVMFVAGVGWADGLGAVSGPG